MTDTSLLLPMRTGEIRIHDAEGFAGMRKAGRLVAECLDMLVPEVKPDVTLIIDGWHGDHSRMYGVGNVKRKAERLMDVTYDALMAGIAQIRPGKRFGDIGGAISEIARLNRMSVVEDFCGHGLGRLFHDEPNVVHSSDYNTGPELKPGMFFTVEPMLNLSRKDAAILPDGWTAVTRDRQLSAQYEHSVGVTEDGVEIFSTSPKGWHQPHKVQL